MKKFIPFLLLPVMLVGVAATYTITQLTSNTSPSDNTIIEVYDPSASPKSGKYLLTNLVTQSQINTGTMTFYVPLNIKPTTLPAANFARSNPDGEATYRLLFAQNEYAIWQMQMPSNYTGGLAMKLDWKMQSATSGDAGWSVEVWAVTPGDAADMNTASFDTANTATTTAPGTAGRLASTTIALANADNLAPGDWVQFRVKRTDALSGDLSLESLGISFSVRFLLN